MPFVQGEVISHAQMSVEEGAHLQRGMNYQLASGNSVFLMSVRKGAPYQDVVENDGRILIYEGHDAPRKRGNPDPKSVDQPEFYPGGSLTQNGLFKEAAARYNTDKTEFETIRVYEKIKPGIGVFNGAFALRDCWQDKSQGRSVFKFRLELLDDIRTSDARTGGRRTQEPSPGRMIPPAIKLEVRARDDGQCVECGSVDNLHFDHIIPYSKGGSSRLVRNVQLLCARHNLSKSDRII